MSDTPWYLEDESGERWQRHVRLVNEFREWLKAEGIIPREVAEAPRSELDELI